MIRGNGSLITPILATGVTIYVTFEVMPGDNLHFAGIPGFLTNKHAALQVTKALVYTICIKRCVGSAAKLCIDKGDMRRKVPRAYTIPPIKGHDSLLF